MDLSMNKDMYSVISSLNKRGIAIIMVTHDISAAIEHASHILHLAHRPKFFGTTADYLDSDAYKAAFRRREIK